MPDIPIVLAKSDGETLAEHTRKCCHIFSKLAEIFPEIDTKTNISDFYQIIFLSIFFHDFGKASSQFQKVLLHQPNQWNKYRHEILSAPFIDRIQISPENQQIIKALILLHHKDILEILAYRESDFQLSTPFSSHIQNVKENLPYLKKIYDSLPEILDHYGFDKISQTQFPEQLTYTKQDWELAILWMNQRIQNLSIEENISFILAKGLINASDYLASAGINQIFSPVPDVSQLYQYQNLTIVQETCREIKGDAIIISPTGSGKTEAALFWASNNLNRTKGSRIFYTLPYTASINAMYLRLCEDLRQYYQNQKTNSDEQTSEENITPDYISLLHGKASYFISKLYSDDETSKHLKTVSRLICSPYKIITPHQAIKHFFSLKGYEMGLLEMYQGVFILDEIHSYEAVTVAQIIGMCKFLKTWLNARILLMSATLPSFIKDLFIQQLGIDEKNIVTMDRQEQEKYTRHECVILPGTIFDSIPKIQSDLSEGKRVLVVCNTVLQAQTVYKALKDSAKTAAMLHSRFILRDREEIEKKVISGEKDSPLQLLVGTQAIEVSLDIDYDTCYTEPAPIDALIQRFGRVNRKRTKGISQVHICTQGSESDRYIYDQQKVERTLENLADVGLLHEWKLQKIVDTVYSDGFGEREEDFTRILTHFEEMTYYIKPFTSNDAMDSGYFEQFDSIEVVPVKWMTKYLDDMENKQFLEAMRWTIQISKRQYMSLKKADRIEKSQAIFIDAKYDEELGLLMKERENDNFA